MRTGAYSLHVQGIQPTVPSRGGLTCNAAPTTGSLAAAQLDAYTFAGQAGQNVTVSIAETGGAFLQSNSWHPNATLIGPDGSAIVAVNANGRQTEALTASGAYVLKVNANNYVTAGTYNVSIQCQ